MKTQEVEARPPRCIAKWASASEPLLTHLLMEEKAGGGAVGDRWSD